jgi:hypothetical protein
MGSLALMQRKLDSDWLADLDRFDTRDSDRSEVNYNDFVYFENPTRLKAFVGHKVERSLRALFTQLRAENRRTRRVWVYLHRLYDNACEILELSTAGAERDPAGFLDQFDDQLKSLDLTNPLTEIEIEVCPWHAKRRPSRAGRHEAID